ncbi:hypothetical protein FC224_21720 [Salmonella enterica]|nr:hypothetical protein [Salmonella enterica]
MVKIISDMILCTPLNYHISCPFSAAQIRFPAKPENYSPDTSLQSAVSDEPNRRMRKLPNSVFDGRKSRRVMLK